MNKPEAKEIIEQAHPYINEEVPNYKLSQIFLCLNSAIDKWTEYQDEGLKKLFHDLCKDFTNLSKSDLKNGDTALFIEKIKEALAQFNRETSESMKLGTSSPIEKPQCGKGQNIA